MLIEVHILQNHAPSNLNRDDTGSPKQCIFGGVKRARISSQCLKRSIRRSYLFRQQLDGHLANRTRKLPDLVQKGLVQELGEELAKIAAEKASGFGNKEGKERATPDTAQTVFLTEADVKAVTRALLDAARSSKSPDEFKKKSAKDLQSSAELAGYRPTTVDIALFGRMTTSPAFRDVEASAQVAHAISTHKVDMEFDYFTAVDDLRDPASAVEEDAGADMIGDVEYNSACYYKYFSVDFEGLCSNLTGESMGRKDISGDERQQARDLAAEAIDALLKAAIKTTPTGKQNTFAAHQLPTAVLVEVRPHRTPVSYANAFVDPARRGSDKDLCQASLEKLGKHVQAVTKGFNLEATSRLILAPEHESFEINGVEKTADLERLCTRLKEAIAHE